MNTKINFSKEACKLAAYAFVTVGLVSTTLSQFRNTNAAFTAAFKAVTK